MPKEALKHVLSVAVSKKDQFWPNINSIHPHQGWLGRWQEREDLAFLPVKLKEILSKEGYEPNAMLNQWKNMKWLKITESSGLTAKVTIDGKRSRCYVIKAKYVKRFM